MSTKFVEHELFVCDCENISHQMILTTWDFEDGTPSLYISIKLNQFLPWYKRILIAFKYLFKLDIKDEFDVLMLNDDTIDKLQKSLEKFKDLQKNQLDSSK